MLTDKSAFTSTENAVIALTELYGSYGYRKFKFSKFEEYDLYADNKSFLKCENIITFSDLSGRLLALKPDITLSIVRSARAGVESALKYYYSENVYRVPRGSREYREIMQVGLELIGNIDLYSVSEVVFLALKSLKLLGGRYTLDISHIGLLSGIIDALNADMKQRNTILELISEKNRHGLLSYCASISADTVLSEKLSELCSLYGSFSDVIESVKKLSVNSATDEAVKELCALYTCLESAGVADGIMLDFSVVSDVDYYNGIIFQGYIEGVASPVLSGGRYDPLMKKFGKSGGAVGFAVYTDALESTYSGKNAYDVGALVLYDDDSPASDVLEAVKALTEKGISVRAERSVPKELRYEKLYEIKQGRLTEI